MNRRRDVLLAVAAAAAVAMPLAAQDGPRLRETEAVLSALVESYGPSGLEGPVRETVARLLPAGVRTATDSAGNLRIRLGTGEPLTVFVAHLDELGLRVTAIRDDGTLELRPLGGFFASLWEAQPALVHGGAAPVPGIFLPRDSAAARTHAPPPLRIDLGTGSRAATEALGVTLGSAATMPKSYRRLAGTRATGRSFDDRVGCTALVLAIRALATATLPHAVEFVFSTREEIGLEGARAVANELGASVARVYAIDTFVSADAPLEVPTFAVAPLGRGAVSRALDNSSVTAAALVDSLVALAAKRRIALQVGSTNGGNDGSVFVPWGAPDVPMGWPLRYSHSPAELVDLRDVVSLADLVTAVAREW